MSKGLFQRLQGELAARDKSPGLAMSDVLALPEPLDRLAGWMLREQQFTLKGVAGFLGGDEQQAVAVIAEWLDRGFIREAPMRGEMHYRVRMAPKRPRQVPLNLWSELENKVEE